MWILRIIMKYFVTLFLCFLFTVVSASPRTALVIGNSDYKNGPLANPENDAEDISKKLESLGFEVFFETNQNTVEMKDLIVEFGSKLKEKGGVGLFYYAGHGLQIDGKNYLAPVDLDVKFSSQAADASVDTSLITGIMEEANNPMNIILLDACRDNPFPKKTRSASGGLARMDSASGTIIAYSTSPGDIAADGEGRNSPYTSNLLKYMGMPGLTIEQVFKKVRVGVEDSTGKAQLPWETSSLRGDFYFVEDSSASPVSIPLPVAPTIIASVKPISQQRNLGSSALNAKKLSIFTNPEGSIVKILNSDIPYSMGVKLEPGDYRVEITKEGFLTKKQWINIDKDNRDIQITLVPE